MKRSPLSRRTMLLGAGVALALPWLEAMALGRAEAGGKTYPTRFLTFYVPNGIYMEKWTPATTGPAYALPPMLAALAPVKDELQILSNFANVVAEADEGGHAPPMGSLLNGHRPKRTLGSDIQGGISLDQIIANAWRGRTRFPSLELGTVDPKDDVNTMESGFSPVYLRHLAWGGPRQPLPKELDARNAFIRLFGGGATPLPDRSVLDYVLDQAGDLQRQLGVRDRQKLDEYMSSVRDVETQLAAPPAPEAIDAISGDRSDVPGQVRSMLDVITLALQTDATRVITYMFGNAVSDAVYGFLGLSDGHHSLSHHDGDPGKLAKIATINTWEIQQLAYLLTKMKAIEEGDGTLLDHSIVYFTSEIGDGNTHARTPLPVLVAGKGGGQLTPGRHLVFADNPPLDSLYSSFLLALGLPHDSLDGRYIEPVAGLVG